MTRILVCMALLLAPALAAAEGEPWKAGVSTADQDRANALFAEANALFAQQAHGPALEKYKAAIALWDHPLIRFNMAVSLIRLERMLEAADAIEAALRFGRAPFTAQEYAQVLDYQTLVGGRVGEIEVTCKQEGATVALDGKSWFACPGSRKQRVLVGEHTITGEHATLIGRPTRVNVAGGAVTAVAYQMTDVDDAFTYERRYPGWLPWTVIGVSGLGLLVGLLLEVDAQNQINQFDQDVAGSCAVNGCQLENPSTEQERRLVERLLAQRDRAKSRDKLAIGVMSVAAVGVVSGIVLAILNRPVRRARVNAEVSNGGAVVSVGGSF